MFKRLEGDTALVRQGGVYKVCDLYEMGGALYARFGGGYIRLRENGTTSKDGVQIEHMEIDVPLFADKFGRLTVTERDDYKPAALPAPPA
jgi:hypothetical protein